MDINIQRKMPDNYTILRAPSNKYDMILGAVSTISAAAMALGFVGLAAYYIYKSAERREN